MKKNKAKCETCPVRGYSPDFCRFHKEKISKLDVENCAPQNFYKKLSKNAALGAGIGIAAATVGIAVIPAVGMKVVIGHALLAKLTAGGGAAGAGINSVRGPKEKRAKLKKGRKKNVVLPMYLRKGN